CLCLPARPCWPQQSAQFSQLNLEHSFVFFFFFLSFCLSVCLSVCLCVCLCVCLPACLHVPSHVSFMRPTLSGSNCLRPYHTEHARSRPLSEAKQCRAWLVLGWEIAWEYQVLQAFLFLKDKPDDRYL